MAKLVATDYHSLSGFLSTGRTNRIGHNTTAELTEHDGRTGIEIRLHGHHIITLWEDGSAIFTMCGWGTVTTRDRLNQLLPGRVGVSQSNGFQKLDRRWAFREQRSEYSDRTFYSATESDSTTISSTDVLAVTIGDNDTPPHVSVMENIGGRRLYTFYPVAVR